MYIIFLGAPGAGKGTQAATIARELNLAHIAPGDLFRQASEQGTSLGIQAKSYMEEGKLVPDEMTIQMVLEHISAPDCEQGVILDGFPRNLQQAGALDKALAQQGKAIDKVIYIKVSEEELLRRLTGRWICRRCQTPYHAINSPPKVWGRCNKCGGELYQRPDDTIETVKKRLQVYFAQTAPLINYYKQAGRLLEVDGEEGIDEVEKRIALSIQWRRKMRRKAIKGISKKRTTQILEERKLIGQLLIRSRGRCEKCGRLPDFRGLAKHEIKSRAQGGDPTDPQNCLMVCGSCHSPKGKNGRELMGHRKG